MHLGQVCVVTLSCPWVLPPHASIRVVALSNGSSLWMSAPLSIRRSAVSSDFHVRAVCRAERFPIGVSGGPSISAPASNSIFAICVKSRMHAKMRGDSSALFIAFTLAPLSRRAPTASVKLFCTATWRGENPKSTERFTSAPASRSIWTMRKNFAVFSSVTNSYQLLPHKPRLGSFLTAFLSGIASHQSICAKLHAVIRGVAPMSSRELGLHLSRRNLSTYSSCPKETATNRASHPKVSFIFGLAPPSSSLSAISYSR
mmetsp:Transcript_50/g.177  ORF Transcript_50/g.177 Transcript_50/m.177 type:complete len:258 (+) Transcript_50:1116-1889(+)